MSSENHPIDDPESSHRVLNNQININSRGKKEKQFTVKMKHKAIWKYFPGSGVNKVVYDDVILDTKIEVLPGVFNHIVTQNAGKGEHNMMLTASAVHPNPLERKYEEDLEREMSKLQIVSDSINEKVEPNFLRGSIKHQKHIGFVDDPGLAEIDSIKKHMQNHRDCRINQVQFNRIKSHMERYKEVYKSPSNAQAEPRFFDPLLGGERNPRSGFKEYMAQVAEW
jgi:hypothetical protein